MSPVRLTFLYPHLFKPLLATEVKVARRQCYRSPAPQAAPISTVLPRQESMFPKRAGKAVEPVKPIPPPGELPAGGKEKPPPDKPLAVDNDKQPPSTDDKVQSITSTPETPSEAPLPKSLLCSVVESDNVSQEMVPPADLPPAETPPETPPVESADTKAPKGGGRGQVRKGGRKNGRTTGPMETVLKEGESPQGGQGAKKRKPAMSPPPYIHSFDTYVMCKSLENGGFTEDQSIQLMKALRLLLAMNHNKARDVLVSKSDVENESYLFRAACSELSTEVKNNRRVADEHMRQQRTMLQHEVDNLTQTLNQELATLEDTVKNMFNERRMTVREEEGEIQGAIQQLHLKISAKLNSDAKSDIEGVRWVIMRMAAGGLGFVAVLALGMFNYISTAKKARIEAEKKQKIEEEQRRQDVRRGKVDHSDGPAVLEILAAN